ncbi:MAG: hypothetical protein ACR2QL_09450 [Woeseiaceae bacterium]
MTRSALALPIVAWLLIACSQSNSPPRKLSFDALIAGEPVTTPVAYSEFARPDSAAGASNQFRGRLQLATENQENSFELQLDSLGIATANRPDINELPNFDFEFVQDGNYLVPITVGPVVNDHGWWEFVLSTGEAWDEADDQGWSRAAIPFALKELREDCMHNGAMTFLFRDDGSVSSVAFQLVNQTCSYMKFEMSGLLAARYIPGPVAGEKSLLAAERNYRASRIPIRAIDQIGNFYPGAAAASFGSTEEIDPTNMSTYGLLIDGVHYASDCRTPYGAYPYCNEMAVPSYSTAKSVVGGLGLMLLENDYPGAAGEFIAGLVPECGEDWKDVTIEHALDMTTGHFESPDMHGDENAAILGRFFAEDHAGKIDVACNTFPRKAEPGTHLSYHTWDTYLAGTAMNYFLRSQQGGDADFFDDLVVAKLWQPLNLSRMAANTRRSYDEMQQPYTGFGLTLLRDDVVKLARFIGVRDGRIDDEPLLDRNLFDALKQRNPEDRGMVAELETIRYNNGFRSFDVASYLECEEPAWVVVLSGFGGIIVAIMPNDTVYYYFSDGGIHRYLNAVRESHRIRPMCD